MLLSFSTVGTPRWSWSDIISAASDLGYDGIELRGLGDDLFLPRNKLFMPGNLPSIRGDLQKRGLRIACLASDTYVHDPGQDAVASLKSYMSLASALGAGGIRVLCDSWGEPGDVDGELVLSRMRELAPCAEDAGVELWIESNGVWADTARLRGLLDSIASPNVRAVWDIHHPARNFGESVEDTIGNLGEYIRHVHFKDGVMSGGKPVFKMLGYGDLPLERALGALKGIGYAGFISMEWVKRWNDELEDAGIALPHFIFQMKRMLQQL